MRPIDNPFNVSRREELIRLRPPAAGWEPLLKGLQELSFRAAITGPHGHGKSTLLGQLMTRLEMPILHLELSEDSPHLRASDWLALRQLPKNTLVCLDGAEQLGVWYWSRVKRLARHGRGLLITTHAPRSLPVLHTCKSTPELLAAIVADLLRDSSLQLPHDLSELHARHHGNLRDALDELYDYCQRQ